MRERDDDALRVRHSAGKLLPITFAITQIVLFAWFFRK